ncbi:PLP-dependent transferase [Dendrothele bispora CBS 962.96]|uniref:PLP-dependent transferase n=1 Tax=Dendrothele bispora (strain CBS 962.96) TaxID=1314807 RepID=A0A4S8KL41_DENBC|nr:PLP-dependent transferase [Dendrothele bispora CBS 962.96]
MGSWFLGNHGENAPILTQSMTNIIENVKLGREEIWKNDPPMIQKVMSDSAVFQESVKTLQRALKSLAGCLSEKSVPFYSPRYAGHMSTDLSLPAVLGYALAQHFNQNNVTPEASALTSTIEYVVGQQLCYILGFETSPNPDNDGVVGWGHITADGSIANLESIWHLALTTHLARNLKYYPLSLQLAMREGEKLESIRETFEIELCNGKKKLFKCCDSWDLLNLSPSTVADIPRRLYYGYGIPSDALSDILRPFSIQTLGMEELNKLFDIKQHAKYMVSIANHYSWPKGCAIAGIGSENLIEIGVDLNVRMDIKKLEKQLRDCLNNKQAVFSVVVVCGTTEHGAVDPVKEVVELREEMKKEGLAFMIHADAAWGGYFACKCIPPVLKEPDTRKPYAFSIKLNEWTNEQLYELGEVDTITIDPHKSGYIPYPAGALCMRDSRFRFLTTWTSAYINTEGTADFNMGIYGVEGSKPGAAAVAVLLSHEILGLERDDKGGYANLLGTAMLTGIKMYGHWVTMDLLSTSLVVTALNRLPSEIEGKPQEEVQKQKKEIYDTIVNRENYDLENDQTAMELMMKIGSDTMINAFVCNFKIDDKVNKNIVQANFLNDRLYERLSVRKARDVINDKPLIINRTVLKQSAYGDTLQTLKKRMNVNEGKEDVVALSNVSMSPFPTTGQFLQDMMGEFRKVAEQEIKNCLVRIKERPAVHVFLLQGVQAQNLYLVYLPMLHIKNHQRQLILSVAISDTDLEKVKQIKTGVLTVHTSSKKLEDLQDLNTILENGDFIADIYSGFPSIYSCVNLFFVIYLF